MEQMELDFKEYELRKNSTRKMYESLHSQASSMLQFTLEWKELEERLDSIRDATKTGLEELHEREKQLDAKELKVESKANEFQEREKQLKLEIQSKVDEVFGLEMLINQKQEEAKDSRNQLISLQSSIKQHAELGKELEEKLKKSRVEFDLREKQMKEKEESLNQIEKSIEEKKKLAFEEQKLREERLKEPEKEHKKSVQEGSKTLTSREELLRKVEQKVKYHSLRKKSMAEELSSSLDRREKELEFKERQVLLKEKQMSSLESMIQEREKQLEADSQQLRVKERQVLAKSEAIEKFQQECKGKEKQLELKTERVEKLHQEREKKLDAKERQVEEQVKELELTKKQLESTLAAKDAIVSSSATDHSKINIKDGAGLQLFMYEHLKRNDTVTKEISALLQQESLEPAKLVLDAMEGFHPSNTTVDNKELDSVLIRRACILLLEELKRVLVAQINPQVRRQAMELANDWKAKIKAGTENQLEDLGFLQLVRTYQLTPAYDAKELQGLIDMVPQHEHATELSRVPGTTDKAPANSDVKTENAETPAAASFSSPNLQSAATVPPAAIMDIQNCIDQNRLGKAFGRISKLNLFDTFPPAKILKEYVEKDMKCKKLRRDHKKDQAVEKGIELLRRAIQWIKQYNLESEYPSESIEKQILRLQKLLENRRNRTQKKRPCSTVDSSFQQHQHKFQRTSLSDKPHGLHPDCPNPILYPNPNPNSYSSVYSGQSSIIYPCSLGYQPGGGLLPNPN